jgi:hypothetical protein
LPEKRGHLPTRSVKMKAITASEETTIAVHGDIGR